MKRPSVLLLAVALTLLAAGCTIPTSEPAGTNVTVTVDNQDTTPHDVRLFVLSGPAEGFDVTFPNGSTRSYDVDTVTDIEYTTLRNASDLAVRGSDVRTDRTTVQPNTGIGTTYEDVATNATVVYAYAPPDQRLVGWGTLSCDTDDRILRADIDIAPNGTGSVSTFCRG